MTKRHIYVTSILTYVMLNAGCAMHTSERSFMNQVLSAETDNCKLEVEVKQIDSIELKISYCFQNQNQQNAYLFNRIYRGINEDGAYTTDRNVFYVEIDNKQLVLSKKIIPVPKNKRVEKPIIPCVTRVKPASKYKEITSVSLPLKPWTPYYRPQDAALADKPIGMQVYIEFGFFLAPPEGDKLAQRVETSDGTALYFYPFPFSSQKLMRVGALPWTIPVRMPK
jgi:hypothetical protein